MQRILITGANRGIGLALVQAYLQRGAQVFATCRNPASAAELNALATRQPDRLRVIPLDVTDQASIDESVQRVRAEVDGLDLLINNAGIYPGGVSDQATKSASFGVLEAAAMLNVFHVNAVAPVLVTQAYGDLLRAGQQARVINMSSDAGSITNRADGCNYSYPASKAALNMLTRCLAGDFRADDVVVVSIHPGWLQTDMGGAGAPLTPDDTVPTMIETIARLTLAASGTFLKWDGSPIAW